MQFSPQDITVYMRALEDFGVIHEIRSERGEEGVEEFEYPNTYCDYDAVIIFRAHEVSTYVVFYQLKIGNFVQTDEPT